MANGTSGTKGGGNGTANATPNVANENVKPQIISAGYISPNSTGGKIVKVDQDQWVAEADNGYGANIFDTGMGFEVRRYMPNSDNTGYVQQPGVLKADTKSEAFNFAKGWIKANTGQMNIVGVNYNPLQVQVENAGKKKKKK